MESTGKTYPKKLVFRSSLGDGAHGEHGEHGEHGGEHGEHMVNTFHFDFKDDYPENTIDLIECGY